jgi:hypothetical protein
MIRGSLRQHDTDAAMDRYESEESIRKAAQDPHITANELDLLVSKTRELTSRRERELSDLRKLLEDLETRLRPAE